MLRIYAGTRNGVVKLQEQSGRWHAEPCGLEGHDVWVVALQPQPQPLLFAGTYGTGLFCSHDGGAHWEQVGLDGGMAFIRAVAFKPAAPQVVYVGAEPANVYRSADGGASWQDLGIRRLPGAERWYLPYSPREGAVRTLEPALASPELLYGGVEQGGVLRSTDGGDSWSITHTGVHPDVHSLAVARQDPELLFAATGGGVYRSRDGAAHWDELLREYTRAVVLHPQRPELVLAGPARRIGSQGRILVSGDGGDSWTQATAGLEVPMPDMVESFVIHPARPALVYAVTSGGRLLVSQVDELHWEQLAPEAGHIQSIALQPDHGAGPGDS